MFSAGGAESGALCLWVCLSGYPVLGQVERKVYVTMTMSMSVSVSMLHYVYVYVCVCVYHPVCAYVCVYVYVYVYVHAHICAHACCRWELGCAGNVTPLGQRVSQRVWSITAAVLMGDCCKLRVGDVCEEYLNALCVRTRDVQCPLKMQ